MKTKNLIALNDLCINHNIELSFISSLQQTGLIEITTIKESDYIEASQLPRLEKFICYYYELDINLEGIETITHLLQRMESLHDEIISLRNRLRLYETNE